MQRHGAETTDVRDSCERPVPDEAPPLENGESTNGSYISILVRAFKRAGNDHVTTLAAALAYYAFLAIPSALLIAVGIFSMVASPSDVSTLVDKLGTIMPKEARGLIHDSLVQMTQRQATGLTVLVVGLLLAVWSLGGAMQNLMWALNIAYDRDESRGFVKRRLTSWGMLGFAVLGFALAFGLLVLGPALSSWVGNAINEPGMVKVVWWAAQWPLLVCGLLVAFAGLLYLGPNVEDRRWKFLSFGALFAIVLWLLASGAFAFYVSRFGSYNKTWGSLSAVVILLTWFWLSSVALLLGAEINAEAERSRAGSSS